MFLIYREGAVIRLATPTPAGAGSHVLLGLFLILDFGATCYKFLFLKLKFYIGGKNLLLKAHSA